MIELRLKTGQAMRMEGSYEKLQELIAKIKQARLQNEWVQVENGGHITCAFPAEQVAYIGVIVGPAEEELRRRLGNQIIEVNTPMDHSKN